MYQPLQGSSYFALPKIWAKPQLGIINPQNTDNRCFKECMKCHLASEEARKEGAEQGIFMMLVDYGALIIYLTSLV